MIQQISNSMHIPTRPRHRGLKINITPLIDVVFLLIIFFLVASHFVRNEPQETVELPEATQNDDEKEHPPRRINITVSTEQEFSIAGKPLSLQEVEQMLFAGAKSDDPSKLEVRIRGDRRVPYKSIEPLMLACARTGIQNVGFAVTVNHSP